MRRSAFRTAATVTVVFMAMAAAETGQYGDAVRWQRQALEAAAGVGRRELMERLAANLKLYEAGRPCRLDTKRKILLALGKRVSDKDEIFGADAGAGAPQLSITAVPEGDHAH